MRGVAFGLLLSIGLCAPEAGAQSLLDKAKRGATAAVTRDDAEMAAAMRKARETLPQFLALARAPRPSTKNFSVKLPIRYNEGNEYFWLRLIEFKGEQIVGEIRNTPKYVKTVRFGQKVIFAEKDIVDWQYLDGKAMKGNFTACALLKRETKATVEAFKHEYGLECEP